MNRHKEALIQELDQLDPSRLHVSMPVPSLEQLEEATWPLCGSCSERKAPELFAPDSLTDDEGRYRGVCIECTLAVAQAEIGL